MKKLTLLFLASITLIACTDDDNGTTRSTNDFSYLPLAMDNTWDYDVATGTDLFNDNLEITSVNGASYEMTATPDPANGLMSGVLSSGTLTATSGKLISNGNLDFSFQGLGSYSIPVANGVLYDQNALANEELFNTSGSFQEAIDGFNLDINYTAKTVHIGTVPSITVPAGTFTNVLHSQLIINVSISSQAIVSITLLQPQNVIVVNNYWAQDVGLIKSDNQLNYALEDFSSFGITLPIPQSANILTTQDLTAYTLN